MLFITSAAFLTSVIATALARPHINARHGNVATFNNTRASNSSRPKVILDNDWYPAGFIPYLQALQAGWDVLGLIGDTANSWALQTTLHGVATLEVGNLSSCIPVYRGASYPLLNTPELFQAWEYVHGKLAWEGAFAPENLTLEAEGNDPTSGDPNRVSRAAFTEGYANATYVQDVTAAEFLVQSVRRYPGEVSIYSGGALTNIAMAVRMDPTFAANARELIIMGGYVDSNLLQTTGSVLQADLSSDINLMIDPEASKIALSADFPNITLVGNAANQEFPSQEELDDIYEIKNPYSYLVHEYYPTDFPYWDETAAAVMVDPSVVTNSTRAYLDVDTSYASPTYGNIHVYQEALAPRGQKLQEVNLVLGVDATQLKRQIKQAVQYPPTCSEL